jgi:hypothetical protein
MSQILKGYLQPAIYGVLTSVANQSPIGEVAMSPVPDPLIAQQLLADRLAGAIAECVQKYINTNVLTVPEKGPVIHIHKMMAP